MQTKAIRFPTDARLYSRMREKLVAQAQAEGIELRQSYRCIGLKVMQRLLKLTERLMKQERNSKKKIYSIHEPKVECIAKGKAHQRYEFGNKVGFVVSGTGNWILGAKLFCGNPFDGHTLQASIRQAEQMTGKKIEQAVCDLGYRGHGIKEVNVLIVPRNKSKATRTIRRWWKRRNAIEPIIGHEKTDHRLERNRLTGELGDSLNVILSACGFNLKKLVRAFCAWLERARKLLENDLFGFVGRKIQAVGV